MFRVKPFGNTVTADISRFSIKVGKPFETPGVDFAAPLHYKISKKERGTCYILIFMCATTGAVHLENDQDLYSRGVLEKTKWIFY